MKRTLDRIVVEIVTDKSDSRFASAISARKLVPKRLATGTPNRFDSELDFGGRKDNDAIDDCMRSIRNPKNVCQQTAATVQCVSLQEFARALKE